MSRRITTRVEGWVEEAIDKYGLADKDQIIYDLQMAMLPQGPQMAVAMFMPSGLIGMMASTLTLIEQPAVISQEDVENMVQGAVEALRTARSDALSEVNEVQASFD